MDEHGAESGLPESQEDVIRRLAPGCTCPEALCLGDDGECAACGEIDPEWDCLRVLAIFDPECASCGEGDPLNECPKSKRPCGHHCNHVWESDECDWCGTQFLGDGETRALSPVSGRP